VAVSTAKAVTGPRIPEVTLSLPLLFGLAILLLIIGAGAVYAVLKSMGGQAPVTAAAAATITPTQTATGTATLTPTASLTPSPSPTWTLEPPIEYKVASGDLCSSIAFNFNVTIQSINETNGINCEILSAGQILKIPRPTPTPLPSPTATLNPTEQAQAECSTVQVTVKAGDTLGGIAANYAVSAASIQAFNNKPNDTVYEGEKLVIPLCERQLETPSPTPVPPYAAPNLLLPADGASFVNLTEVITLQWSSVGTLRQNESYRVTVEDITEGNARQLIQFVTDTKLIVPENFRPAGTTPHILRWSIITVRQTGTDKDTGNPIWEPAGSVSVERVFSWLGSGGPAAQPTTTPKP